jgi:DNA-binding transcriptional regulator YhcF (GntR family)
MELSLERDALRDGRPVYRQIADHFLAEIEQGQLAAGARLPAIRDLARSL